MMAEDVSLMVQPLGSSSETTLAQILTYRDGMWHDTFSLHGGGVSLSKLQDDFNKKIDGLMRKVGTEVQNNRNVPPLWAYLHNLGSALYKSIVPPDVHMLLKEKAATGSAYDVPILRIHTYRQVEWIPWEIMYDGQGFLGLRFQIARLPIVPGGPDLTGPQPHKIESIHNLLAEHIFTPQSALFAQWQGTFTGIITAAGQELRYPSGNGAGNDWPVLDQVADATKAGIVHITCHGGLMDKNGEVYWTLNDKTSWPERHHLYSSWVSDLDLRASKPLVFGNACASTLAEPAGADATTLGSLPRDLGTAFLDQGALAFVGTFAPITNQIAIPFAKKFYQKLLQDNLPIGKALWSTKQHYFNARVTDPSWLFYCLYGLPEMHFEIAA